MSLFKSSNPALNENKFRSTVLNTAVPTENAMTINGTLQKFGFLLLMVLGASFYTWKEFNGNGAAAMPLVYGGAIAGFIIALVITFKQQWSPFLAPLYALCEGLFVGGISAAYQNAFAAVAPNIIINAVGLTFGVAVSMYLLYSLRIITVTQRLRSIILMATMGVALFYLLVWILNMFGVGNMQFLHEGSTMGIIFSLVVVTIAAMNLLLDFDMIEQGAGMGAPKYMEWYGAFGLLVTIIWLYLEILRLLAKLSSRK